ncbi:MAG: SAM-dependent chlorinase/fluorinase [Candidatus Binatia bacterium]|nr:SAM-dependent chlorinase/fluorinase [Candidatus Binatia bacterium]
MPRAGIVTLLTDFGSADPYVGIMKGVILARARDAAIVDLTHEIPPQQVLLGALALRSAVRFFPAGTIHVAVVDPGVGSERRALAIASGGQVFLGPDNGLLTLAAARNQREQVRVLANRSLFLHPVSNTFHGRDIFAAVAGHLLAGVDFSELGPEVQDPIELDLPRPAPAGSALVGRVLYVDRFGNLITNFDAASLAHFAPERLWFRIRNSWIHGLVPTYASLPAGGLGALFGSWELVEIAQRNGNAQRLLQAGVGDEVVATERDAHATGN